MERSSGRRSSGRRSSGRGSRSTARRPNGPGIGTTKDDLNGPGIGTTKDDLDKWILKHYPKIGEHTEIEGRHMPILEHSIKKGALKPSEPSMFKVPVSIYGKSLRRKALREAYERKRNQRSAPVEKTPEQIYDEVYRRLRLPHEGDTKYLEKKVGILNNLKISRQRPSDEWALLIKQHLTTTEQERKNNAMQNSRKHADQNLEEWLRQQETLKKKGIEVHPASARSVRSLLLRKHGGGGRTKKRRRKKVSNRRKGSRKRR
jgi:hypothetical protein